MRSMVLALMMVFVGVSVHAEKSAVADWGYQGKSGPEHWGSLGASFSLCNTGMAQSPIDMVSTHLIELDDIKFSYVDAPFHVINNGHTLEEIEPISPMVNSRYPQHGQTANHFSNNSTITFDGDLYLLEQFHFHTPSEHTLNHQHFAMEMHLVHHNARHESAVIAVFMKEGKHNQVFQEFLDHAPTQVGGVIDDHEHTLNPKHLLPKNHSYYRYFGSFTTPPCSEGVIWAIMHDPIEISTEQIRQFTSLLGHTNIRPTQPLHKRFVLESKPN